MKKKVFLLIMTMALAMGTVHGQGKVVLFDMSHGQQDTLGLNVIETYRGFVEKTPGATLMINREELTPAVLKKVNVVIVLTPIFPVIQPTFTMVERAALLDFVKNGGRLMVVCEEDRRTPLEHYGINDIVKPFGMEYAEETPVRNNVGAIGLKGEICKERRELPYSGGRVLHGGTAVSIVNDEGGYQHMAFVELENGGKLMAAGDAMVLFFLGSAEGQRLSGRGGAAGDQVNTNRERPEPDSTQGQGGHHVFLPVSGEKTARFLWKRYLPGCLTSTYFSSYISITCKDICRSSTDNHDYKSLHQMTRFRHGTVIFLLSALYLLYGVKEPVLSQTCCSGGVPLSGNIGFAGAGAGTLQMEFGYDLNYLSILKKGSERVSEDTRIRLTQSMLYKAGYSITDYLAVDALFSYVFQSRRTQFQENTSVAETQGVGDALVMLKLVLSGLFNQAIDLQIGAGPKIPLGKSDLKDERGITYNADMQPGSGSWDILTWAYGSWQANFRPTGLVTARIVARLNGVNNEYLGSGSYQFGNSIQAYTGYADQVLLGKHLLSPSLQAEYRHVSEDRIAGVELLNTGGQWLYLVPGLSWHIRPKLILNLTTEIPIYSRVNGIQLSPTFRFQTGIYVLMDMKKKNYN